MKMDKQSLIKVIDELKDLLSDIQIENGEFPDLEIGKAIYDLKKAIDELLQNKN